MSFTVQAHTPTCSIYSWRAGHRASAITKRHCLHVGVWIRISLEERRGTERTSLLNRSEKGPCCRSKVRKPCHQRVLFVRVKNGQAPSSSGASPAPQIHTARAILPGVYGERQDCRRDRALCQPVHQCAQGRVLHYGAVAFLPVRRLPLSLCLHLRLPFLLLFSLGSFFL